MEKPFRDIPPGTCLIETMLWRPGAGVALIARHRDRMCRSARRLGFAFDAAGFAACVADVAGDGPLRLRLTLDAAGRFEITQAPAPAPAGVWRVALGTERLTSDDPWLQVKSTRRALYDRARAALPAGIDELIFLNERGHLCEGTITNLLVELDGAWLTPPLSDGVLPGVMRAKLLARGALRVASLRPQDLARASRIRLCNALRGEIAAELVAAPAG